MPIDTGILIVGAGPTGLGAAWRLDQAGHRDWLLMEAAPVAGGLAGSEVDEHGFTWDYGGHVQFSHYGYFDRLMTELLGEDGWHQHDRESWVWVRGRFVPYPFQLNIHRLPEADAAAALAGLEAAAGAGAQPANFGEWMTAAFGDGITRLFMRPYNTKVWARDPERLAWHWIGDRVATVDLARVRENLRHGRDDVSWGPNNRFRFPKRGGTGAIWRTLAARLADAHGHRMRFHARLAAIDTAARIARFSDGTEVRYRQAIVTIPIDELVASSDLRDSLSAAAADLESTVTHVIGVGLNGQAPDHVRGKCWMYFPEADCPFYRVTHFSHYAPANVADPSSQWSLMAEVAESPYRPLSRADVVAHTIDGLLATRLVQSRAEVHHTWHRRLPRGYPVPSLGRDAALGAILPAFEARGVRPRGRFGAWTYEVSNQDHSFAQGVEAVDACLEGAVEETLHHPARVNARRP